MTAWSLTAALRAEADGFYVTEAAVELLIAQNSWLARDDFACLIYHGTGRAAIDWEAAVSALDRAVFPARQREEDAPSRGQPRLRRPGLFGEAVTGIDGRNVGLLVKAVPPRLRAAPIPRPPAVAAC